MVIKKYIFPFIILVLNLLSTVNAIESGNILVASKLLDVSSLEKTILLVVYNEDDGFLAIAINRPTNVNLSELIPTNLKYNNHNVYFGGAEEPSKILALIDNPKEPINDYLPIFDNVYLLSDIDLINEFNHDENSIRFFAGYFSWDIKKINKDLELGLWVIEENNSDILFANNPLTAWFELNPEE